MQTKKLTKKRIWVIVLLLLICVAATTFTLMNRLGLFMPDSSGAFDLAKDATSKVLDGGEDGAGVHHEYRFTAYDENGTWGTEATVEIFSISYNENGEATVKSSDGDKVIAPGTSGSYVFKFKNTGTASVDYTLSIETSCTEGTSIPVQARLSRYDGKWVAGSADAYVDTRTAGVITDTATVGSGRYVYYTLEWQWPFEGDDELDTMLGNLAADQDVTFTVELKAVATEGKNPESKDGILMVAQTGDVDMTLLWILLAVCAILMVILLLWRRKDEDDEE